jgi:hypothetical protein
MGTIKSAFYIIIGLAIISSIWWVYDLYKENQILTLNNQKLEFSITEQDKVIKQKEKDLVDKERIQNEHKIVVQNLENEKFELEQKFTKEKTVTVIIDNKETKIKKQRDIGKLAVVKPKMVQTVINKGTIKEFRCLEAITNPEFKNFDNLQGVQECK